MLRQAMHSFTFVETVYERIMQRCKKADFLILLLFRLYLAPIFILAGWGKLTALDSTAYYFGEILHLPLPYVSAVLAGSFECIGGVALLFGFCTRIFALPLIIIMLVAAISAHGENGWHVLPESQLTMPWEWRQDLIDDAQQRKQKAVVLLKEYGNYEWLTEAGNFTVLKNGIEFAATYCLMLFVLFFWGGGAWLSLDFWLARLKRSVSGN